MTILSSLISVNSNLTQDNVNDLDFSVGIKQTPNLGPRVHSPFYRPVVNYFRYNFKFLTFLALLIGNDGAAFVISPEFPALSDIDNFSHRAAPRLASRASLSAKIPVNPTQKRNFLRMIDEYQRGVTLTFGGFAFRFLSAFFVILLFE
jgi:hypothetical protein